MVSNTKITKSKRNARDRRAGAKRKANDRNKGSTPKFDIHPK